MSSALRKKIEAASGVPPSLLQTTAFWSGLAASVDAWSACAFMGRAKVALHRRRALFGETLKGRLEDNLAFALASEASPGLCAIIADEACAKETAALRLGEATTDLESISPVFLRLMFEQSAAALWRAAMAAIAPEFDVEGRDPFGDPSSLAGGLAPRHRYLEAEFGLRIDGRPGRLSLVFDFEFVRGRVEAARRPGAAEPLDPSCSEALQRSVRETPVSIDAVIDQVSLTIGACSRLAEGEVIELPGADPAHMALVAETVEGGVEIARGALGAWKEKRAFKLDAPFTESLAREIAVREAGAGATQGESPGETN